MMSNGRVPARHVTYHLLSSSLAVEDRPLALASRNCASTLPAETAITIA